MKQVLKRLATAESGHAGEAVELEIVRKDGTECFVELSLSSVQIRGRWHGIGIARDITDRKRAEEKLKLEATTDTLTASPTEGCLTPSSKRRCAGQRAIICRLPSCSWTSTISS